MNLFQNPFYIIGVSTRDSKQAIVEACDAKSLTVDADLCTRFRSVLTQPRNRLSAEIAWLPGLSPARALGLIEKLEKDPKSFLASLNGVNPLARCNALVSYLEHHKPKEESQIISLLIEIARSFDQIDYSSLLTIINEDRQIAKIPLIQDIESIKQEMQNRSDYMVVAMKNTLNNTTPDKVFTEIVSKTIADGKQQPPFLIEKLADKYQIEVQKYLDQLVSQIRGIISNIEKQPKKMFEYQMPILHNYLRAWDQIAQPIQLIHHSKGLDDSHSKELAQDLRGLAITMANTYEMHSEAKQINKIMFEIFKELPQFAERVAEDLTILDGLIQQKRKSAEEERKWRDEMSLDIEIGKIIKDRLIITPERISYKNRTIKTEDVSRVRWGIYVQYTNGIRNNSYYTIWIGTPAQQFEIECNTTFDSTAGVEKRYQTILDKLWKNVCVRLIGQTLQRLSSGEKLVYNDIVVDKDGILLRKQKFLGSDPFYAKWEELSISNAAGAFVIQAKKEKKATTTLSYRDVDNVHILEAVMRFLWKDGNYQKLSRGEFSGASETDEDTNAEDQDGDDDEPIEDGIADNDGDGLIKIRCPHCKQVMTVSLQFTPRGSKIMCSNCSQVFIVPQ